MHRKIAMLIGDGMGDYPCAALQGRTPLQAARVPQMRRLAAAGRTRLVQTVPVRGLTPGSDVANLALLGYNPAEHYTGRAPIEAAGAGLPLQAEDTAFRCNLVTLRDGSMADYSAGQITTAEARPLVAALDAALGGPGRRFHAGVGYRHLLIWFRGPRELVTQPPHDIAGRAAAAYLPAGPRQAEVRALMDRARAVLQPHPVNRARAAAGRPRATDIWLWGQGGALQLPSFQSLYGLAGGVISAVDLVRGLGRLAGLTPVTVPGANGLINTNYAGKVQAALDILAREDFVYVHVEAPDEYGHDGDVAQKVRAIELFDERVVGPIWRALERRGRPYRLILATDHRTPLATRGHTREPVPMAVLDGPVGDVTAEAPFDETVHGGQAEGLGYEWVRELLRER